MLGRSVVRVRHEHHPFAATLVFIFLIETIGTLLLAACGDSEIPTAGNDGPVIPGLADPPPDGAAAVGTITAADLAKRVGVVVHD